MQAITRTFRRYLTTAIRILPLVLLSFVAVPYPALALYTLNDIQTTSFTDISSFVSFIVGRLFTPLVTIFISLAVIVFVWGIAKYIYSGGDARQREQGRKLMVYGIIAIFVMVSFWGLARLVASTVGF